MAWERKGRAALIAGLALSALAPACGSQQLPGGTGGRGGTSGTAASTGRGGAPGAGGASGTAGASGIAGAPGIAGAFGIAGASGMGVTGMAGAPGAGPTGTAGAPGAGGVTGAGGAITPPSDGGFCVADVPLDPSFTPASGAFFGSELSGVVCTGGAYVYAEDNLHGIVSSALYGGVNSQATNGIQFEIPTDAVGSFFLATIGLPSPTPGTYDSPTTCGSVAVTAYLPVPSSVDCRTDAGPYGPCPAGCALEGPVSGPTCMPVQPETYFAAQAATDCLGNSQTQQGSWTLNLESVDLEPTDAGALTIHRYRVHGALSATLVGQAGDAGSSTVSLSLSF